MLIGRLWHCPGPAPAPRPYLPSGLTAPNGGVPDSLDEAKAAFRAGGGESAIGGSGLDMLSLSISAHVKLFGRRPQQGLATGTGAGVRKAARTLSGR
jgi:hypothetical protein